MFGQTAYEAFYTYLGLYLHESSIKVITSQPLLKAILLLIFSVVVFFALWGYFGRYVPSFLGGGGGSSSPKTLFKIFLSFFLGMMALNIDSSVGVKNNQRVTWHDNQYIDSRIPKVQESYKVSFLFDLITRPAEEIAHLLNIMIDQLFQKTNSEVEAPSAFYRAILYAGSMTLEDPQLRDLVEFYTNRCFEDIIPMMGDAKRMDKISEFFQDGGVIDQELKSIVIEMEGGVEMTCLDVKNKTRDALFEYARKKDAWFDSKYENRIHMEINRVNIRISSALTDYYRSKRETQFLGLQKGAEIPGAMANAFVNWDRFFSWDGFLNLLGWRELVGSSLTAARAKKFSEYLRMAPHMKGMAKMFLIALFPWLVFLLCAGKWKALVSWALVYTSISLWAPIWTLLYHVMTSVALSTEVMNAFGRLNDGVSLYSERIISAQLYEFYAIYAWLQVILGPVPTVILGWGMLNSFLKSGSEETSPAMVNATTRFAISAINPVSQVSQAVGNKAAPASKKETSSEPTKE